MCDFSGSWSAPYEQAGYEVKRIDLQNGGGDVRLLMREKMFMGFWRLRHAPVLPAPAHG